MDISTEMSVNKHTPGRHYTTRPHLLSVSNKIFVNGIDLKTGDILSNGIDLKTSHIFV